MKECPKKLRFFCYTSSWVFRVELEGMVGVGWMRFAVANLGNRIDL